MSLLTPQGKTADKVDRIMLMAMWAAKLQEEILENNPHDDRKVIIAGIGKPTFPINEYLAKSAMMYWTNLWSQAQEARHLLNGYQMALPSIWKIQLTLPSATAILWETSLPERQWLRR